MSYLAAGAVILIQPFLSSKGHVFKSRARALYPWTTLALSILWIISGASTAYAFAAPAKIYKELGGDLDDSFVPQVPYFKGMQGNGSNYVINGVGAPVRCRKFYNAILDNTSEFDKLASAVATTVMTLLPALLSFGPLPSARIGSLIYFNAEITFFTAAMTLGLYNTGLITLAKDRIVCVKDLFTRRGDIELYGTPPSQSPSHPQDPPPSQDPQTVAHNSDFTIGGGNLDSEEETRTMSNLRQLYDIDTSADPGNPPVVLKGPIASFRDIRNEVLNGHDQRPRRGSITFLTIGFGIAQLTLFGILVRALPMIDDITFIWICPEYEVFTWWLGLTAVISGFIRTIAASDRWNSYEVLHLSPLPPPSFRLLGCKNCSVATPSHWKPPTRTPSQRKWDFCTELSEDARDLARHSYIYRFFSKYCCGTTNEREPPARQSPELVSQHLKHVIRNLSSQHAMVVVIRQSNESTPPLHPSMVTFLGYIQALMLVFLTFLFGGMMGGTLIYTVAFVIAFLTVIVLSRMLSLWMGSWMEKKLDMIIIEYEEEKERKAIMRALYTMPGVLVESKSDGYTYSEGYRFDKPCKRHEVPALPEAGPPPKPPNTWWRAVGGVCGFITGLLVGFAAGFLTYIASIPPWDDFFVDPLRATRRAYIPTFSTAVFLGAAMGWNFFLKTRSEFRRLGPEDIGTWVREGTDQANNDLGDASAKSPADVITPIT